MMRAFLIISLIGAVVANELPWADILDIGFNASIPGEIGFLECYGERFELNSLMTQIDRAVMESADDIVLLDEITEKACNTQTQQLDHIQKCIESSGISEVKPQFIKVIHLLNTERSDVCDNKESFYEFDSCMEAHREEFEAQIKKLFGPYSERCDWFPKIGKARIEQYESCGFTTKFIREYSQYRICRDCKDPSCS